MLEKFWQRSACKLGKAAISQKIHLSLPQLHRTTWDRKISWIRIINPIFRLIDTIQKMNSTGQVATCRRRTFSAEFCGAIETSVHFKQMRKWFDFRLISSESKILVSWQLRSHTCLKTSKNKSTLRVQALTSQLLFSPVCPSHWPYPQSSGVHANGFSFRLTLSQDFPMWMQYKM